MKLLSLELLLVGALLCHFVRGQNRRSRQAGGQIEDEEGSGDFYEDDEDLEMDDLEDVMPTGVVTELDTSSTISGSNGDLGSGSRDPSAATNIPNKSSKRPDSIYVSFAQRVIEQTNKQFSRALKRHD